MEWKRREQTLQHASVKHERFLCFVPTFWFRNSPESVRFHAYLWPFAAFCLFLVDVTRQYTFRQQITLHRRKPYKKISSSLHALHWFGESGALSLDSNWRKRCRCLETVVIFLWQILVPHSNSAQHSNVTKQIAQFFPNWGYFLAIRHHHFWGATARRASLLLPVVVIEGSC